MITRSLRIEFPGAFYHVTSRGNERRNIFRTAGDRERFLDYLGSATTRYGAIIHAYCLMSNHYHLLVETPRANLSQIMRHINGAYTTYFNVKRTRAGHLLQGRYKAILVEADEYAEELSRYMHLNPVRAGIVARPELYRWSSYLSYIGKTPQPEWLKRDFILGFFGAAISGAKKSYQEYVEDVLGKDYDSPFSGTVAYTILGGADFIQRIITEHVEGKGQSSEMPAVRSLNRRLGIEEILLQTQKTVGETSDTRDVAIYLCHRYTGEKLKKIGERFGLTDSGVSKASWRMNNRLKEDTALLEKVREALICLGHVKVQT